MKSNGKRVGKIDNISIFSEFILAFCVAYWTANHDESRSYQGEYFKNLAKKQLAD